MATFRIGIVLLLLSVHALAAPVATVEGLTEYRLDNGLRILLFPDASKPTFTLNVTYLVGSRHEGYGESGMAHLLEHMLFKGTATRGDMMGLFEAHGAGFNGSTSYDRTNYYEMMPSTPENLRFAVELEADRMVNSKVAKVDLDKEFSVVRNEFEMGETDAKNVLLERLMSTAFLWHNYGKATIGSRADIERVPIDRLKDFYRRYYQPDNALVVLAGKFDEAAALALLTAEFGKIPRPARVLSPTYSVEPVQDGERTVTLRRNGDVQLVGVLYHGLAGADPNFPAEEAVADILTRVPSGRLYRALVETKLAAKVDAEVDPTAEPGAILFMAEVPKSGSVEVVQKKMIEVIEGLGQAKLSDEEIARFKTRAETEFSLAMNDSTKIGIAISEYAALGDWRLGFVIRDREQALNAAQITKFAADYLRSSNRTSGVFLPDKAPSRAPSPSLPNVAAMVHDYRGRAVVQSGEVFVATPENIDKRTETYRLPSGMDVALLSKKTRGGSVQLVLAIRAGDEKTLAGKVAAAGWVAPLTLYGTTKRSHAALKDELDRQKCELRVDDSLRADANVYRLTTTREHLLPVIALLSEIVRQPAFTPSEIEAYRAETLSKMEESQSNPQALTLVEMARRIHTYPPTDIRYTPTIAEELERLRAVKAADIGAIHRQLWGAGGGQVAVVGDFDTVAVKKALQDGFGTFIAPEPYRRISMTHAPTTAANIVLDVPDKELSVVGFGQELDVSDEDADYPALQFANYVFGGGAKSRLFSRLRQKEGVSYGALSSLEGNPFDPATDFLGFALCAPVNALKAARLMREELARLLKERIPVAEIADAKRALTAEIDKELATDEFVAGELVTHLETHRNFGRLTKVLKAIQALDGDKIRKALARHIDLKTMVYVDVGDQKKAVH